MRTILLGLYIACELIANVTASKPVQLGSIVVPAAIFIYTLTFTLIDLINESLGKAGARKVILAAFIANLLLAAYAQFAVLLPPAPFYSGQEAFAGVLGSTPRIVFASLTAYLVSALIDAEMFALWRIHVKGPKWARVLASNTISTGVDSVVLSASLYGSCRSGLSHQANSGEDGDYLCEPALIYLVRSRSGQDGRPSARESHGG
jgi:uncharacterized integral membrane protein (TIGR00697 family)